MLRVRAVSRGKVGKNGTGIAQRYSSDRTDTADDQRDLHNVIEQETAVAVIIVSAVIAVRIIA